MKPSRTLGRTIWEGDSLLDGKPIVVIAIPSVYNIKTGPALQCYILRQDISPSDAANSGEDYSICGNCVHRGTTKTRSCYVTLVQGPRVVWKGYQAGKYPRIAPSKMMKTLLVRLGAYGDPAAVPVWVWNDLVRDAPGWTGFTHSPGVQDLRHLCQASVETAEQAAYWQERGYRTYRTSVDSTLLQGEVYCPASEEMGHKVTCAQCMRCNGSEYNVAIRVHGAPHVRRNFALNLVSA